MRRIAVKHFTGMGFLSRNMLLIVAAAVLFTASGLFLTSGTDSYAAEYLRSGTYWGLPWGITTEGELQLGKEGETSYFNNIVYCRYRDPKTGDIVSINSFSEGDEGDRTISGMDIELLKNAEHLGFETYWPWAAEYTEDDQGNSYYKSPVNSVKLLGNIRCRGSFDGMFQDCGAVEIDLGKLDPSEVFSAEGMFRDCFSLKKLDLSMLDMANVRNTSLMFSMNDTDRTSSLAELKLPKGLVNQNNTDLSEMFNGCSSLKSLDVSRFDTSKVTAFTRMFNGCRDLENLDVSGFDTASAEYMNGMFCDCSSLKKLDVSGFKTGNLKEDDAQQVALPKTSLAAMFMGCSSLEKLDLSSFDMEGHYRVSMLSGLDALQEITFGKKNRLGRDYLMSDIGFGSMYGTGEGDFSWRKDGAQDGRIYTSYEIKKNFDKDPEKWAGTYCRVTYCDPGKHSYEEKVILKATPDEDGLRDICCTVCGYSSAKSVIWHPADYLVKPAVYNGRTVKPVVTVKAANGNVISGDNYTVQTSAVNAGKAQIDIIFKGDCYSGKKTVSFTVEKAANPLKLKVTQKKYNRSKLKKAAGFSIGTTGAKGKVTYTPDKKAKKAKLKVTSKGKVKVPKKCAKGTYKITVKAAGNNNYKSASKTVKIIVK